MVETRYGQSARRRCWDVTASYHEGGLLNHSSTAARILERKSPKDPTPKEVQEGCALSASASAAVAAEPYALGGGTDGAFPSPPSAPGVVSCKAKAKRGAALRRGEAPPSLASSMCRAPYAASAASTPASGPFHAATPPSRGMEALPRAPERLRDKAAALASCVVGTEKVSEGGRRVLDASPDCDGTPTDLRLRGATRPAPP